MLIRNKYELPAEKTTILEGFICLDDPMDSLAHSHAPILGLDISAIVPLLEK